MRALIVVAIMAAVAIMAVAGLPASLEIARVMGMSALADGPGAATGININGAYGSKFNVAPMAPSGVRKPDFFSALDALYPGASMFARINAPDCLGGPICREIRDGWAVEPGDPLVTWLNTGPLAIPLTGAPSIAQAFTNAGAVVAGSGQSVVQVYPTLAQIGAFPAASAAPSATIDTTNASNIASGSLGVGGAADVRLTTSGAAVDLHTSPPTRGSFAAAAPIFSFYPTVGFDTGDHQRAQHYVRFVPAQDATIAETGLSIDSTFATGYAPGWAAGTAYSLGALVDVNGCVFKATTAGTSASSGSGPTSVGCPVGTITPGVTTVDGTVTWTLQSHDQSNAKSAEFVTTVVNPGSGNAWGSIYDFVVNSGVQAANLYGAEFDYTNNKGDCLPTGTGNCADLFLYGLTAYPGTASISIGTPPGTPTWAWHYGLLMNSANLNKDADLSLNTSAAVGVDFNSLIAGTHATATVRDNSTSPTSLLIAGTHSGAAVDTQGATTNTALVVAANQQVCFAGFNACLHYDAGAHKLYYVRNATTVFSLDDSGNARFAGTVTGGVTP